MRPWCGVRARVSGRFGLNVVDTCRPSWGAILTEKMRATPNGYQLALLVQARFRTPRPNARMHEGTSAPLGATGRACSGCEDASGLAHCSASPTDALDMPRSERDRIRRKGPAPPATSSAACLERRLVVERRPF